MPFCKGLSARLHDAVKKFDDAAELAVSRGLIISTNIKTALSSPLAATLTSLVPMDWPEDIRALAMGATLTVINDLTFLDGCLKDNPDEHLQCYLEAVSARSEAFRNSQLFKIASRIAALLHEFKLPEHMYDLYVQTDFTAGK
jgi:hypothetical protein